VTFTNVFTMCETMKDRNVKQVMGNTGYYCEGENNGGEYG
jgi:hypothetical protein